MDPERVGRIDVSLHPALALDPELPVGIVTGKTLGRSRSYAAREAAAPRPTSVAAKSR